MADQLRDKVNAARRAGYSEEQIFGYLRDKNPNVGKALEAGYSPTDIMKFLAPEPSMGEEFMRKAGVFARGVGEALAPVTAGATTGATVGALIGAPTGVGAPIGALAGSVAVPTADALTLAYNKLTDSDVRLPSSYISSLIPGPRAETPTERVIQTAGSSLVGTAGSVGAGRALAQAAAPVDQGLAAVGREASRAPIGQLVTAPVSAGVGQTVTEMTDNPFLGLAASVATSAAMGARPVKREKAPTSEEVLARSKANYDILDQSGFQLDKKQFNQRMTYLPTKLEVDEGYVSGIYPKVDAALDRLQADRPKNVAEITALRKIIANAAGSADASERRMGSILLDDFDNYVLNAPSSTIVGGDKSAIEAWKMARQDYSKFKKAELIQDIVTRAEVSQSGKEVSIAQGLSALAKNDKKMRFFTPDERQAIREAAKGGPLQSMLRTIAKFTPMTPAAAIFTAVSPFGAYTAAGGLTARQLATLRREQQINRLTEQMLMGRRPEVLEGMMANEPMFITRGIQNLMGPVQMNALSPQSENNLAP